MAAIDAFLEIDGIKGESIDAKLKDQMHLEGWSWGVRQQGTGGRNTGSAAGTAAFDDLHISKLCDKSSPEIFYACASGKHIPKVTLRLRKAGEKPMVYIQVTLSDCLITSYSPHPGGAEVSESFNINFSQAKYEYFPQKKDGTPDSPVTQGWSVAKQEKL